MELVLVDCSKDANLVLQQDPWSSSLGFLGLLWNVEISDIISKVYEYGLFCIGSLWEVTFFGTSCYN